MLVTFGVGVYLLLTIAIGLWASRRVQNAQDFILAGRSLSLRVSAGALFATWFGSETVLGAASKVGEEGMLGAIEDPLGAALCLFLIGIFFAKPLYRMNLLTFGDYYRERFDERVEVIGGLCLIISYIGWVAAQMVALGVIGNLLFGISIETGILAGSLLVVGYTYWGGMWSVSILDYIQNIVIVIGMTVVTIEIASYFGFENISNRLPDGYFSFIPHESTPTNWLNYFAAWITIGLGSIPQQDVFQRVMAAKDEKTAVRAGYVAGLLYLTVGFLPLVLATFVKAYHPELIKQDPQLALPTLVNTYASSFSRLLFFGALLSAIMSTASGAILAPASILSENIIKKLFPEFTEKNLLLLTRLSVLIIAGVSLILALKRGNIHELALESSALGLVSLYIPMTAGLYWSKATARGAGLSMICGTAAWLVALNMQEPNAAAPPLNPILYGLLAGAITLWLGSVLPEISRKNLDKSGQ